MGGRVDMGAAALRQAALCWWRRCCMTIACSRLCTILSPGPAGAPASCCCVSGGLAMLSLILDLHGEHSFSSPAGMRTRFPCITAAKPSLPVRPVRMSRSVGCQLVRVSCHALLYCCHLPDGCWCPAFFGRCRSERSSAWQLSQRGVSPAPHVCAGSLRGELRGRHLLCRRLES